MSYRNPRFSVLHAALEAGIGSLSSIAGTNSIERLRDYRTQSMFNADLGNAFAGTVIVDTARVVAGANESVNRLLIPPGHDLHTVPACVSARRNDNTPILQPNGLPAEDQFAPDGLIDLMLQDEDFLNLRATICGPLTGLVNFGELCWTRTLSPLTGVVPEFEPSLVEPEAVVWKTRSGASWRWRNGPEKRRYRFTHMAVTDEDFRIYGHVAKQADKNSGLVWFEHPDSGDVDELQNGFDALIDWVVVDGTSALTDGYAGEGDGAIRFTKTSASPMAATWTLPQPADWSGRTLWLDMRLQTDWPAAAGDIQVRLVSGSASRIYNVGNWNGSLPGGALAPGPLDGYYRIPINLDAPDAGGTEMTDLHAIEQVVVDVTNAASGITLDLDNLRTVDPEKQPRLCEIERMTWKQDSKNPKGTGSSYTVQMDLLEFTG